MNDANKPALQKLHGERNLLDAVLDSTGGLIVVLDSKGRVRHFDQACERLSGYSFSELEGTCIWEHALLSQDAGPAYQQSIKLLQDAATQADRLRSHWLSKSGQRILIEWRHIPLRDSTGALEYIVAVGTDITAGQAIQRALQESEAESRALFEQAAVGIAYVAPDGRWIDVNSRICEILGYERDYLLATTFQAITYPEDLAADLDYVEKVLRGEIQTYSMEKRYIRADNSLVWANLTVSLVRDADDKPDYFIALVRDISQRKETELLLRNSERQLREAQRITHIGSWELDLVNNRLHWSDEIYQIFEIDQTKFDATYETFLNAIHPQDRDVVDRAYAQSLRDKMPYEIAHRLLMPDGRIKWVNERCESDFAEDGTPLNSLGTVQDITEQVRIEQELRELNHDLEMRVSERTYELASERNFISTILDTANALVMVLDSKGRVVRMNRACEKLTGYGQAELAGKVAWEMLVAREQHDAMRQIFNELQSGGEPSNYEFEWICRNGDRRVIAWSNSTIKNSRGAVEYVIETGIDITERKAVEKALIRERDKAEQASRAKSDFLSRMSHELRTPLNAILGFSQLLNTDRESPLNPIQHENVKEILQASNHLLDLINDMLDMSRIEAGRLQVNMDTVPLAPLLNDCVTLMQAEAEQRDIQLQFGPIVPVEVRADATRLKQVIFNLLSNAIKYNRERGQVRVSCLAQANGDIRIAVSDTGEGLSSEQQAMLFAPFERLEADRKAIPGAGIGLALSKRLTEFMGGSIGVESEVGKGSTFWVQLGTATT